MSGERKHHHLSRKTIERVRQCWPEARIIMPKVNDTNITITPTESVPQQGEFQSPADRPRKARDSKAGGSGGGAAEVASSSNLTHTPRKTARPHVRRILPPPGK